MRTIFSVTSFGIIFLMLAVSFTACNREADDVNVRSAVDPKGSNAQYIEVGKALAKAVQEVEVREFLKNEALKQFDQEYDILFQLVKNKEVRPGETFMEVLKNHASSDLDLEAVVNQMPLLTLFVPDLPSFSPQTWDVHNDEVPLVSVKESKKSKVLKFINAEGETAEVDAGMAPAFPVIVLKNNERVALIDSRNKGMLDQRNKQVFSAGEFSYFFLQDAADKQAGEGARALSYGSVDPKIREAYEKAKAQGCSSCYHRDYIYYSIFPPDGVLEGRADLRYAEAITSIKFENMAGLQGVSSNWAEGNLELHFTAFFVGGQESLDQLEKTIYVNTNDLFVINYERKCFKLFFGEKCFDVEVGREPKTYVFTNPIYIAPWEMDKYGDRWKIKVFEYDPSTTFSSTVSHQITRGSNFKLDLNTGEKIKIGVGLGAETSTTITRSTTVNYTTESNQLGEVILDWYAPVITGVREYTFPFGVGTKKIASTYELSTGTVVISVETLKRYN